MKNFLIILGILVVIAVISVIYFFGNDAGYEASTVDDVTVTENTPEARPAVEVEEAAEPEAVEPVDDTKTSLGESGEGTALTAYHFGSGEKEVLFVGGVHSGFAPGTVAVAEELMDALESGDVTVPEDVKVTVIPNLNPDAAARVNNIAGRLNANEVDLNRNFGCQWQADGTWRDQSVSGGSAPFSEPEAAALRSYVAANDIEAAVVYYAAGGGVYASDCDGSVLRDSANLTQVYADASGYSANQEFDFYEITGDMVNWMASEDIPAISVLLSDYSSAEWTKNMKGIEAVLAEVAE